MFFQTAGIEIALWIPPLVAFIVSFFTSMAGVSGAFLLLPFQMSCLGYTAPSVSGTNQLYNIVAIPSGVYQYWKEGRMVWPLVWIVIAGTLPGVLLGAILRIKYLSNPIHFKVFAAGVLFYIGLKILRDTFGKNKSSQDDVQSKKQSRKMIEQVNDRSGNSIHPDSPVSPAVQVTCFNLHRIGYTFYGEQFDVSIFGTFLLSLVVGVIGGIYGIGGGSIMAPFFVTFFGLPIYTIAGAALMGTFVTSVSGVAFYQAIAPFYPDVSVSPDWLLGILFGLGGMGGMFFGAKCQKYVPAKNIKWMLAGIILFTAMKYAIDGISSSIFT